MSLYQPLFLLPITVFYIAYLAKMQALRRQGIQGDTLGKGSKPKNVKIVEQAIKVITYTGAPVQYICVILPGFALPLRGYTSLRALGFISAWAGTALFIASVRIMKTNWRAGYTENQDTHLVTEGIYKYSRNPAFAGFNLIYIGCALAYPNILTIIWSVLAVCVFHLQILSEEKFLTDAFGESYENYKKQVCRYFGRKNISAP